MTASYSYQVKCCSTCCWSVWANRGRSEPCVRFSSFHHQAKEELRPVKEDFEAKNKQLLDEMPKFYQSRIDYFQPSFEALIRAQVGSPRWRVYHSCTDTPVQQSFQHWKSVWGGVCITQAVCFFPCGTNVINPQRQPTHGCVEGLICLAPLRSCRPSSNLELFLKQLGV